ncbi:MAG: hypothetical protein ABI411_01700 [Tahibacter sp.]
MQRATFALAALALGASAIPSAHAEDAALKAEVAELRAQLAELRGEIVELRQMHGSATPAAGPIAAAERTPADAGSMAVVERRPNVAEAESTDATTIGGYGEISYNHPTRDASASQADLRRAVLAFTHRFDDSTRVVGEFEWEHAVVSADDSGEAEVEQLYVEHELHPGLGVRAGLILMPLGTLNERHEPPTFYGVERNFVETAIIPSTWREGGVALYGNTQSGWNWNVGITTGFDLAKWDAASSEGRESPLRSIHQELQLAKARDPSFYAATNWQGIPGLTLGGGVFTGAASQGTADFLADSARVTLADIHARWQSGPIDLSALYARGRISDTGDLNLSFVGNPTPVPEAFWGGYVQGAWRIWQRDEASVAPFLRYESFNTAASYAPMPQGLEVPAAQTEHVWTAGANYWLNQSVVFKADYQRFDIDRAQDRVDLGMGYMF